MDLIGNSVKDRVWKQVEKATWDKVQLISGMRLIHRKLGFWSTWDIPVLVNVEGEIAEKGN